jgi:hypothetical protein
LTHTEINKPQIVESIQQEVNRLSGGGRKPPRRDDWDRTGGGGGGGGDGSGGNQKRPAANASRLFDLTRRQMLFGTFAAVGVGTAGLILGTKLGSSGTSISDFLLDSNSGPQSGTLRSGQTFFISNIPFHLQGWTLSVDRIDDYAKLGSRTLELDWRDSGTNQEHHATMTRSGLLMGREEMIAGESTLFSVTIVPFAGDHSYLRWRLVGAQSVDGSASEKEMWGRLVIKPKIYKYPVDQDDTQVGVLSESLLSRKMAKAIDQMYRGLPKFVHQSSKKAAIYDMSPNSAEELSSFPVDGYFGISQDIRGFTKPRFPNEGPFTLFMRYAELYASSVNGLDIRAASRASNLLKAAFAKFDAAVGNSQQKDPKLLRAFDAKSYVAPNPDDDPIVFLYGPQDLFASTAAIAYYFPKQFHERLSGLSERDRAIAGEIVTAATEVFGATTSRAWVKSTYPGLIATQPIAINIGDSFD